MRMIPARVRVFGKKAFVILQTETGEKIFAPFGGLRTPILVGPNIELKKFTGGRIKKLPVGTEVLIFELKDAAPGRDRTAEQWCLGADVLALFQ